jgi:hypothetical protein
MNPGVEHVGAQFFRRLASQVSAGLFLSLIIFFLLFMLVIILRREWIALVVLGIILTMFGTLVTGNGMMMFFASAFRCVDPDLRVVPLRSAGAVCRALPWSFMGVLSNHL